MLIAIPQYEYYTEMLKNLITVNNCKGEPLSNDRLRQSFIDVIEEKDAEHKRNINKITCDDSYQYLMKKKDVSTINDYVYYDSDEHVDTIIDFSKQFDPINDPIVDTHIVDRVHTLSVRVRLFELAIFVGGSIGSVTNVLDNSIV